MQLIHEYKQIDKPSIQKGADCYGQKEVPIIKLYIGHDKHDTIEIDFDTVKEYIETYDSKTGFSTKIVLALFSPYIYENLTKPYNYYAIETSNYWRKEDDGKDYCFEGLKRVYNHITINHITSCSEDCTDWIITLNNI